MTLRTRVSNLNIITASWLRRKVLRLLFGRTIIVCTCGAVCDFDAHRKDHFYCGIRLNNRIHNLDVCNDRLIEKTNRLDDWTKATAKRIETIERLIYELSEVEKGHA